MARVLVVTPPQDVQQVETLDAPAEAEEPALSPQAWRDVQLIADRLQTLVPFDCAPALYSSDLGRAAQTMGLIAETFDACPTFLSDLRATGPAPGQAGALGGLPAGRPGQPRYGMRAPERGKCGGDDDGREAEGQELLGARREWVERAYRAMTMIESDPAEDRIVVTHGSTLSWVVAAWLRIPIEACLYASFHAQDGSITILEEVPSQDRVLRALGDSAHLVA